MDIGPVRRRLTAEPVSSPVPGDETPVVDPVTLPREHPAADALETTSQAEPAR
jgi:hypothetical protein